MASPRAVRDNSVTDVDVLRNHLRLNTSDYDDNLERCLAAAKSAADRYCNNPFLSADGNSVEIPEDVEMWVLQTAARFFNMPEGQVDYVSEQGVGVIRRNSDYNAGMRLLRPHRLVGKLATRGGGS